MDKDYIKCLSRAIEDELYDEKRMNKEKSKMSRFEERVWQEWLTDANYHSYESYPVNKQVEIWNMFSYAHL